MGETERMVRQQEKAQPPRIDLSQLRPQVVQQIPQQQNDELHRAQTAQRVVTGVAKTFDNVLSTNQEWRSSYLRMALV